MRRGAREAILDALGVVRYRLRVRHPPAAGAALHADPAAKDNEAPAPERQAPSRAAHEAAPPRAPTAAPRRSLAFRLCCWQPDAGWLVLSFPRRDPLASPLPAVPIPETASVGPVEVGRCEDGTPYHLNVHGTHVLIAGATGSGKGSWLWSTIRGLLPAMRAGRVQIWALDPKRMELSFGRPLFGNRYAADPKECADLLDEAVKVMQERAGRFAGLQRSHTPTLADPFILVIVDEVAFLTPTRRTSSSGSASRPRWQR